MILQLTVLPTELWSNWKSRFWQLWCTGNHVRLSLEVPWAISAHCPCWSRCFLHGNKPIDIGFHHSLRRQRQLQISVVCLRCRPPVFINKLPRECLVVVGGKSPAVASQAHRGARYCYIGINGGRAPATSGFFAVASHVHVPATI